MADEEFSDYCIMKKSVKHGGGEIIDSIGVSF